MLTVTQLAKQFSISRTTILYYERCGLLSPSYRSDNGYRWYGESEISRLKTIVNYRSFGLPISKIGQLLEQTGNPANASGKQADKQASQEQILQQQFCALEQEIQKLRQQQSTIVLMLGQPSLLQNNQMNKQKWVAIMKAAGLNEQDMENWHKQFERMEPQGHQKFLQSLQIDPQEIKSIRQWSQAEPD